jgi:hypothetical protein
MASESSRPCFLAQTAVTRGDEFKEAATSHQYDLHLPENRLEKAREGNRRSQVVCRERFKVRCCALQPSLCTARGKEGYSRADCLAHDVGNKGANLSGFDAACYVLSYLRSVVCFSAVADCTNDGSFARLQLVPYAQRFVFQPQ